MSTMRLRILRRASAAGAIASAAALAAPAGNLVVTVPGDYPTIQQAVDAMQGIVDAEVRIASDAIFDETVEIGATVALRAAPGFTPSIRGVGASGLRTLRFRPNGGAGDDPIDLTISGLTLLPRAGLAPGNAYTVFEIENDGQAESRVFLDHVRFADPLGGAPDGLALRSVDPAVPNQLHVLASTIELAGGSGSSTRAISFNSHGTAVLSGLDLAIGAGTATGLDIRSPAGGDLDFWLEDATIALAAPADSHSAEALTLSDRVHATLRDNLFLLADTSGAGGVSGIQAVTSSTLSLVLDRNRFVGSDFTSLGAALLASAFAPGVVDLRVSNNVVTGVGVGFALNPQSGTPPATVTGSFVGNTVDGTVDDAILVAGQAGSHVDLAIADNLLTHTGRFGLEVSSIGTADLDEHHDGFFANPLGDVSAPFAAGPGARHADPLYVDRAGGDLRLQGASPMLDAGDDGAAADSAYDAAGADRKVGPRVDLGGYETYFPCPATVTTSHPGRHGTNGGMAFDRLRRSSFDSSYDDWQWLQVDFGCVGAFAGLRRFMTRDGLAVEGARILQGEAAETSLDGVVWTPVLAATSTGWQAYVNYLPQAWHSIPYGWSAWLRTVAPVEARYVRYQWDGDNDRLHEVEIQFARPFVLFADDFEGGSTARWSSTHT